MDDGDCSQLAATEDDRAAAGAWAGPSLPAQLVEIAKRHAHRPALFADGETLSYRDLFGQAAEIAHALAGAGLADGGRRCAVLGGRHIQTFAGILGALLARCTYVPLNPRHPAARLGTLLADAAPDAIVADPRALDLLRALLPSLPHSVLVLLPGQPSVPDWALRARPHRFLCAPDLAGGTLAGLPRAQAEDGAYLLFTSGSTGTPKGVLVRHGNVVGYLRNVAARYRPSPEDRFTQLFDPTFDLSAHDMFLCWGAGAALHCPPDAARMAPAEFVRRHELTVWFSVPSTAAMMQRLRLLRPGAFPSLRLSLFCGEALPSALAAAWMRAAPQAVTENLYGPTEATIAFTAFRLPADPAELARLPEIIPIGTPLPGQRTMILGADGREAAPGEDGELCLSGSQVTGGYWRRPDLTAERFIRIQGTDRVWYRTGDRARVSDAHGLVFLGRMDRQVKIAGHRVELQEVEAALQRAADSAAAAAIAWPVDADGLARGIFGFIPETSRGDDAILQTCRAILPPYAVPARLRRLKDWPLNANGKTDYRALRRMMGEDACPTT